MSKPRSLGQLDYPTLTLDGFNASTSDVSIRIESGGKSVRAKLDTRGAVLRLVALAQEITGAQRDYAQGEWAMYLELERKSGFVPPDRDMEIAEAFDGEGGIAAAAVHRATEAQRAPVRLDDPQKPLPGLSKAVQA